MATGRSCSTPPASGRERPDQVGGAIVPSFAAAVEYEGGGRRARDEGRGDQTMNARRAGHTTFRQDDVKHPVAVQAGPKHPAPNGNIATHRAVNDAIEAPHAAEVGDLIVALVFLYRVPGVAVYPR